MSEGHQPEWAKQMEERLMSGMSNIRTDLEDTCARIMACLDRLQAELDKRRKGR